MRSGSGERPEGQASSSRRRDDVCACRVGWLATTAAGSLARFPRCFNLPTRSRRHSLGLNEGRNVQPPCVTVTAQRCPGRVTIRLSYADRMLEEGGDESVCPPCVVAGLLPRARLSADRPSVARLFSRRRHVRGGREGGGREERVRGAPTRSSTAAATPPPLPRRSPLRDSGERPPRASFLLRAPHPPLALRPPAGRPAAKRAARPWRRPQQEQLPPFLPPKGRRTMICRLPASPFRR
jgi:hypothetical protein